MTQDATPADDLWLENLVAPILFGEAVATFARQLPRGGVTPLERCSPHIFFEGLRCKLNLPSLELYSCCTLNRNGPLEKGFDYEHRVCLRLGEGT